MLDRISVGQGKLIAGDGLRALRGGGDIMENGGLAQGHLAGGIGLDHEQASVEGASPAVFHRGGEDVE
jgi:hypothetical protein